ncbi:uncharacterized protein [Antennarius striatus]|uniref:uncharacterized protein n=1 Tax=Antennarius striatus TaxID=241820 RepID=UPI0035B31DDB
MSCVEKRHMSHRTGSMLHHRFPNSFTDLFMDETDREVSTLTDRAFRSLCVGDDAVYNDEFLYGYSPFSCHKPLAGEPPKKTHKESKKQGQNKNNKEYTQPWKQQQQKSIAHMSSFLKALSATEESCDGILIKNGDFTDSKGESWDKSALRSIQKELSEFSSNYHTKRKGADLPTGKSSKTKNGKSTVKLKKLNIKNFFLHSEFSPFQTWRDLKQFPFSQDDTVLSTENIPNWCDMPFYKELTEAHRKETLHTEETPSCQETPVEPLPPIAPNPVPPSPPPKVLTNPSVTPADKRCPSFGGDGTCAPWRRNKPREKSVIPFNQPGITPQENDSKTMDESHLQARKEVKPTVVKAVEEVSSLASTPFSICQLMTPLIPSRQPTETSEILQGILSPSSLDLPLRPHSVAKLTPEPAVKRDSYKSLASSILFNLKDNRKRVKSHYSPPKFKNLEVCGGETQSPQSDSQKHQQACSEGNTSDLSISAILKEEQTVFSPILESNSTPTVGLNKDETDKRLSDDYLLSNLLQTKREAADGLGEENPISPLICSRNNKGSKTKKQNYPSLNLYKKATADSDRKSLDAPPMHLDQPSDTNQFSPVVIDNELSPKPRPTVTGFSSNTLHNTEQLPRISPLALQKEEVSSNAPGGKRTPNIPEKTKQPAREKYFGAQHFSSKENDASGQSISTVDVIRAAKEAINAAKSKALSAVQSDSISKSIPGIEELRDKETENMVVQSKELLNQKRENLVPENSTSESRNKSNSVTPVGNKVKKAPPPVPKKNFIKSDIQLHLDKQQGHNVDKLTNGEMDATLDLPQNETELIKKQVPLKHVFSAKQNNFIKCQRYSVSDDGQRDEFKECNPKVKTGMEKEEISLREIRDSENIINDLNALKELERTRLSDRVLDHAKNRLGAIDIDEETKAKNDLISRELRNIKKGMLSMRGNTSAKRELFASREMKQNKKDNFTKIDSNVIVNRSLFNDNYDKAKMALEEIISDRQKRKSKLTEQDANLIFNDMTNEESYVSGIQQHRKSIKDSMTDDKKNQNTLAIAQETDLKERLSDLRDQNHMRRILSQTEPGSEDSHISSGRVEDKFGNEPNMVRKSHTTHVNDKTTDKSGYESQENRHIVRQISEESGESVMTQSEGRRRAAPPVPPRSKKGVNRRDTSVTNETDSLKDVVIEGVFDNDEQVENDDVCFKEMNTDSDKQKLDKLLIKDSLPNQNQTIADKERGDMVIASNSKAIAAIDFAVSESILPSCPHSENKLYLSPQLRGKAIGSNNLQTDVRPSMETAVKTTNDTAQETFEEKQRDCLKREELYLSDHHTTNNLVAAEPDRINRATEETNLDTETLGEIPRSIMSPLLLVNGISTNQSPPDQASLSSKSSYFSVESALQRNTETDSNVYHSLENLIGDVDEVCEVEQTVSKNLKQDSDKVGVEYYSLSDHENEPDAVSQIINFPRGETATQNKDSKDRDNTTIDHCITQDENSQTPMSPSNMFSPSLGIPALFRVKDNTFSHKLKKTIQPWSPRGNLILSERREEDLHQANKNVELPPENDPSPRSSTPIPDNIFNPKHNSSNDLPPLLQPPSCLQNENQKRPEFGLFLNVPQEEDIFSGVSPSSEGVESLTTSTADTADEVGINAGVPAQHEVPEPPSEQSSSTCSGNESQTGLPKPPAVLPKSEKAVLRAIKIANRRMKKEEAQKSSHKASESRSTHRKDRQKSDKSDHKSGNSSRNTKSNEKKTDREGHPHSEGYGKNNKDKTEHHSERPHQDRKHPAHGTGQSHDSVEDNNNEAPTSVTGRQGRSSNRQIRDKPGQRNYSSDRFISNVPVYKAHISGAPTVDRQYQRSQSIDRYLGDKVECRLSGDMSVNEKLDPRAQRIEKSIMDEFQQRGRARDKANRHNPLRRSHSIDTYSIEATHPSTLSRQSSHTSQLSRQSSIEHAIVTQSFPMTQRKLLQDPDSGQYFFVDMPIQVKTKTFFDPETGSYVQLPVQPPEGVVPQASPLEVLNPPLVVYHGFVPVPLSPMAQKANIHATQVASEDTEQRHHEKSVQMHSQERHPYLEPVYAQHDHMLGEFLGTEEMDRAS